MSTQCKKEENYKYLLMFLFIIQPILDLVWLNDGTVPELFGFTIPTLVRMLLMALLAVLAPWIIKFRKSHLWFGLYIGGVGIYFVIHHWNALGFQSLVPGNFNYGLLGELFYVVRMLIPIVVMFFVYNSKFGRKDFDRCVIFIVLLMSTIEVLTNVFEIAICSYSDNKISGNIFDWFFNQGRYYYNELASKGLFYWSIVSMILVLLFPYVIFLFVDTKQKRYFSLAVLQAIALFMFGTKATSYSVIIISGFMCVLYGFFAIIKKEYKFCIKVMGLLILLFAGGLCLLQYSPAVARNVYDQEYQYKIDEEEQERKEEEEAQYFLSENDPKELIRFFDNNYKFLSIDEKFIKDAYPYQYDPVFWYRVYDGLVPSQRMQNRIIQEEVLKRVFAVNDNDMDKFFGVGYTRTSNIFNLEKDFVYQYYSMGIIGALLLVGPYIMIVLMAIFIMLLRFKNKVTFGNSALVLGCGLTCCLAYYSGNTLESLGITIVMGMVYGYLLVQILEKKNPQ